MVKYNIVLILLSSHDQIFHISLWKRIPLCIQNGTSVWPLEEGRKMGGEEGETHQFQLEQPLERGAF